MAVLLMLGLYWTVWDRHMQVLYLGRALRTKETLLDFMKWRRVTRHPLVFRGLTGSQRTPGIGASHRELIFILGQPPISDLALGVQCPHLSLFHFHGNP